MDVMATGSPAEALRLAEAHNPQVVLCDWQLGDGPDGVAVARQIGSKFGSHILMMTGQPIEKLQEASAGVAVHAFYRKPVSLETLSEEILSIPL
jgi:CheY-like chemotaxis protein